METQQTQKPILLLPAPQAPEVKELQTPRGTPAAKQRWMEGDTVRIGSQLLRVQEHLPPARKGEAARVRLVSHDLERQYIWTPFRGLRVVGGAPKRRKRRARASLREAAPASPHQRQRVKKMSLIRRLWRSVTAH
jgi:hypothetical protein